MFTKNNQLIISGFFLAVLTGLGIGYLLFHSDQKTEMQDSAEHVHAGESVWTCSMHPQIRSNEPGECPICGMDLIQLSSSTSSDPLVLEMTP
ncbi:MAG: efflux RND transporter periplasmic adaptor subunit, partial [Bacteroidetes bacterium]|nr:efflux RND transporter periplasmic adaptor subunit [Bacteroidota bacterium]